MFEKGCDANKIPLAKYEFKSEKLRKQTLPLNSSLLNMGD
jgi:hypothetical protein